MSNLFQPSSIATKTHLLKAIKREKQQLNKELTADFSILAIFTLGYSVYVAVSIKLHTKRELNALEAKIREATSDTDASQILSARTSTLTTTPDLYASLTNIRHKAEKYAKQ